MSDLPGHPTSRRRLPLSLHGLIALASSLALILAACGAGERTDAGRAAVVRDSAGIMIVENSSPVWTEEARWRVAPEPDLEIGVLDGEEEYQFNRVAGALTLSDGRIVILDAGSAELRYFDSEGMYLMTVGRQGSGPGEFQLPSGPFRMAGDSVLVVADGPRRNLALFDSEGELVRTYGAPGTQQVGDVLGLLSGGDVVRRSPMDFMTLMTEEGYVRPEIAIERHSREGVLLDTLALLPGSEHFRRTETQEGGQIVFSFATPPFGLTQRVAFGRDRVYAGAGDSYQIEVYHAGPDAAGATPSPELLIRLDRPNREVTRSDIERYRRDRLDATQDDDARRRIERTLSTASYAKEMPAYQGLRVDSQGNVWVEEYRAPGEEVAPRWEVFDAEGVWLGTVETPKGFHIFEIGEDYLLGRWRDEFDVQYVRRYPLGPLAGPGSRV